MIAAFLVAALLQAAPQALTVKEYLRDTVHVMNADGSFKELKPKSALPRTPTPGSLTAQNVIKVGSGKTVYYLRPAEVLTEGQPGGCVSLATPSSKKGIRLAATDLGSGNGLSSVAAPCIPARK